MAVDLLPDSEAVWASSGQITEISDEKYATGWTGSYSDYAYNSYMNYLFQEIDTKFNKYAETINQILQYSIVTYNPLYEYRLNAVTMYGGRIFRAKVANSGQIPPETATSNDYWVLIPDEEYLTEMLALKMDATSGELLGEPTAPTISGEDKTSQQIVNAEYLFQTLDARILGTSIIDMSALSTSRAYPILLAKNNLPTNSVIYREAGYYNASQGSMRLMIKGVGCGLNNCNASFLNIVNLNDIGSGLTAGFVKKIQTQPNNTCIAIWLRGGTKYYIEQRNPENVFQLITQNTTLENNWVVTYEDWDDTYLPDGAWDLTSITETTLDSTSTSDTGSAETCGTIGFCASVSVPSGALPALGGAYSRSTYAKLFAVIGTNYGTGDGNLTFNVPDLRGRAIVGLDLGAGVDSNQLVTKSVGGSADRTLTSGVGSTQADALPSSLVGTFYGYGAQSSINLTTSGVFTAGGSTASTYGTTSRTTNNQISFDVSSVYSVASKVQINNIALYPFIYYI